MQLSYLNAWRAVDAVIRCGSVTAAAEALGVSNAAVAAHVRRLEERLERPLFRRVPGGLDPMAELVAVSGRLSAAFAELAALQDILALEDASGKVALTVTQTFAETWLPRHLADLFARRGAVDLRVDTRWEVVDLATSDIHFAIRFMGAPGEDLASHDLMPSGVVPVCTPDFGSRFDLKPGRRDLAGVPVVDLSLPTSDPEWADWTQWSCATGIALGADETPRYTLSGSGVRLARAGFGLVLAGLSEVLHALAEGELIMPFGKETVVKASYWHRLVWRRDRRLSAVQRDFRDWISERAAMDRETMARLFDV